MSTFLALNFSIGLVHSVQSLNLLDHVLVSYFWRQNERARDVALSSDFDHNNQRPPLATSQDWQLRQSNSISAPTGSIDLSLTGMEQPVHSNLKYRTMNGHLVNLLWEGEPIFVVGAVLALAVSLHIGTTVYICHQNGASTLGLHMQWSLCVDHLLPGNPIIASQKWRSQLHSPALCLSIW